MLSPLPNKGTNWGALLATEREMNLPQIQRKYELVHLKTQTYSCGVA